MIDHLGIAVKDLAKAKEFYLKALAPLGLEVIMEAPRAALAAGGKDNGKPGLRPHYHPNYYGAFVYDLDGNNIEAVYHQLL